MKRALFTAIIMMFLIAVFCVPRLQAENAVRCGINFFPIYGEKEGKPVLPVLCLEAISTAQMEAIRGRYKPQVPLASSESLQSKGRIILWDEAKTCNPYIDYIDRSGANNASYSILRANRCK
ncbi:MAG: hypothetical protein GX147_04210 [Deltaproteobacteria bacterium]|nr:hypothetical protein [Deltaproteobacteria bacterium]